MRQGVLYISYDGMLESLGPCQVVAHLERLAPTPAIHLKSFEKPCDWATEAQRRAMRARLQQASPVPLALPQKPVGASDGLGHCRRLGARTSTRCSPRPAVTPSSPMRPLPEDDPRQRQPDISRARELLGWQPTIALEQRFRRTIDDFKTRV